MRGVAKVLAVLLVALLVGGLLVVAVGRAREAAKRAGCRNNLKQIGQALQIFDDTHGHFPVGTVPNADLPPDRRLGWLVEVYPAYFEGGIATRFDKTKGWDAPDNCPVRCTVRVDMDGNTRDDVMGESRLLLCPANPARNAPPLPCPTHYLGVAGVGEDAAGLPLSDPRAGFFGYDRTVSLPDIKDGAGTTLAVAEALDGGPWTAGGRATVRGLSVGGPPYLGEGGQFAALHRGGDAFAWSQPVVTNILLVDGSVRPLTSAASPQVFEVLATIAGNEEVAPFGPE